MQLQTPSPDPAPHGYRTKLTYVTPQMAQKFLGKNPDNRRVRAWWVARLAFMILTGKWVVTHQGIAFALDGSLSDGQHRLLAIVKAGQGVWMYVTHGLTREAGYAIDVGAPRDLPDVAGKVGLGLVIDKDHAATARAMMRGPQRSNAVINKARIGHQEMIGYIVRHKDGIDFAHATIPTVCKHACIRAVVARAWYKADRARLTEFGQRLSDGMAKSQADAGAILLRTLYFRDHLEFGSVTGRSMLYRKSQSAVRAFLARRPITRLQEVDDELFPIPGESDQDAATDDE